MKEFKFDEKEHLYTLDGKPLMGCTTVLNVINKPALIQWAANETVKWLRENCIEQDGIDDGSGDGDVKGYIVTDKQLDKAKVAHRKKKEKAADWGKIVHKAIEVWIDRRNIHNDTPKSVNIGEVEYVIQEDHQKAVDNFVKWARDNNVQFFESEKSIYSEEWWVGGTVDFVCKIDGKLMVGDLKTSSGIYESMFFQTAAYSKMLVEMGMYPRFDGMVVVNCKKDGEMAVDIRKDVESNVKCFEAALTLHKRLND